MILETERLWLKEFSILTDVEWMHKLHTDPEVMRYTGDVAPESIEKTKELIQNYPDYKKYGFGRMAMHRKSDGKVVGWCGLKNIVDREYVDLGYRLFEEEWGKGYTTEASRVCVDFGFRELSLSEIYAEAALDNPASINVMKKVGMTLVDQGTCGQDPSEIYRITKEEWKLNLPQ